MSDILARAREKRSRHRWAWACLDAARKLQRPEHSFLSASPGEATQKQSLAHALKLFSELTENRRKMAVRVGFEPTIEFPLYPRSRRAP